MALDYHYGTIAGLEYQSLTEIYERSIDRYAPRPFFGLKREGNYAWMTYREFGERVERFRAVLASLGVAAGDTVAIISDNRPEWAVGAYATYTLGARWCPMYEAQSDKDWKYIINDSDAHVVIVAHHNLRLRLLTMRDQGDIDVEHIIHLDGPEEGRFDTLTEAQEPDVDAVEPDPDDVCGLIYTSGTTGEPKGVLLTHRNIASNVEAIHSFDIIQPDDVSLSFLPWAHSFGQTAELHGMFAIGASVALVESIPKLSDNLLEVRPTLLFSVPRVFHKLYDGIHAHLEEESAFKQRLFDKAIENSERLRHEMETEGGASTMTRLLNRFYDRVIFSKIRDRFGGRLRYAISGGAKLPPQNRLLHRRRPHPGGRGLRSDRDLPGGLGQRSPPGQARPAQDRQRRQTGRRRGGAHRAGGGARGQSRRGVRARPQRHEGLLQQAREDQGGARRGWLVPHR